MENQRYGGLAEVLISPPTIRFMKTSSDGIPPQRKPVTSLENICIRNSRNGVMITFFFLTEEKLGEWEVSFSTTSLKVVLPLPWNLSLKSEKPLEMLISPSSTSESTCQSKRNTKNFKNIEEEDMWNSTWFMIEVPFSDSKREEGWNPF